MLANYLAAALRNLVRNKLYAAINIAGLTVGFSAALLIALFARDEFSYDTWLPNHGRSYLVYQTIPFHDRAPVLASVTFSDAAMWLKTEFPEIEKTARLQMGQMSLRRGDIEEVEASSYWADPDIFEIFALPVVAGDLPSALRNPEGIVLTRAMARKYFGRDDPIGEALEVNRAHVMKVTAVIEDLPSNTHLNVQVFASSLASFSTLARLDAIPSGSGILKGENTRTYFKLAPGGSMASLREKMPAFIEKYMIRSDAPKYEYIFDFVPLANVHFYVPALGDLKPPSTISDILALIFVGVLVVLAACINFVNLMTARGTRSAVEVGVRKAVGARRVDLIIQFVGSSTLYVMSAMLLALIAVHILLPELNGFLRRRITFDFWTDPAFVLAAVGMATLIGAAAGLYPAFVLSSYRPGAVLKASNSEGPGASRARQVLVVLQFAILIGLSLATLIIRNQMEYAMRERLRFDGEQVMHVGVDCRSAFKNEVAALPGVRQVSCGSLSALNFGRLAASIRAADGNIINVRTSPVEPSFFPFYDLSLQTGRMFAPDASAVSPEATHNPSVILNEKAVRALGFASAEAALGQAVRWERFRTDFSLGPTLPSEIVGVVPDFSLGSVREAIEPTLYYFDPAFFQIVSLKINGAQTAQALAEIKRLWTEVGAPGPLRFIFHDRRVQDLYGDIMRQSSIFTGFSGVAVFIASLGLFGLAAFTAEQRTKEIGIRKAMGAKTSDILRLLIWQFTRPVLWANAIAWPVAYVVMNRWLEGFAYHITLELWTFVLVSTVALLIAVGTVFGHALMVARTQPVRALRYE